MSNQPSEAVTQKRENFMQRFRLWTPLLLGALNVIAVMASFIAWAYLQEMKAMRTDITTLQIDVSYIKGRLPHP